MLLKCGIALLVFGPVLLLLWIAAFFTGWVLGGWIHLFLPLGLLSIGAGTVLIVLHLILKSK